MTTDEQLVQLLCCFFHLAFSPEGFNRKSGKELTMLFFYGGTEYEKYVKKLFVIGEGRALPLGGLGAFGAVVLLPF